MVVTPSIGDFHRVGPLFGARELCSSEIGSVGKRGGCVGAWERGKWSVNGGGAIEGSLASFVGGEVTRLCCKPRQE